MKKSALVMRILLLMFLLSAVTSGVTIQAAYATWTVDDDGPADFHTISEALVASADGDTILVFPGIYNESITIPKSLTLRGQDPENTIIEGSEASTAVQITANYVVLTNFTIRNSNIGILIDGSENNKILDNIITENVDGIWVAFSRENTIHGNTITHNIDGVYLSSSNDTTVNHNTITNNTYGIDIENCRGSLITENKINLSSVEGIFAYYSDDGRILRNTVQNNSLGIHLDTSNGNDIYQNNFIDNGDQMCVENSNNTWDNGCEGNYWSDYSGVDSNGDGIGDTPYSIDENNQDRYPLMKPWTNIAILDISPSKTVVGQGFKLYIYVSVQNQGWNTETTNITVYANTTAIMTLMNIALTGRNSSTLTLIWNTTGFVKGKYIISAYATPVPSETDTADNERSDGTVEVTIAGDINSDRMVDGIDLTSMGMAWGSTVEQPNYNPNADLNGDGWVDGSDLTIMGLNWGQYDP